MKCQGYIGIYLIARQGQQENDHQFYVAISTTNDWPRGMIQSLEAVSQGLQHHGAVVCRTGGGFRYPPITAMSLAAVSNFR